jgi:hypothetical protein
MHRIATAVLILLPVIGFLPATALGQTPPGGAESAPVPPSVAIPRLNATPPGSVAPVLVPPPTAAPAASGTTEARPTDIPRLSQRPGSVVQGLVPPPTGGAADTRPSVIPRLTAERPGSAAPVLGPPQSAAPAVSSTGARGAAPTAAAPAPGSRIALVIGNSTYLSQHYLPNPFNDAADMADALKRLGFTVTLGVDVRRADMETMLARFAEAARMADTALIYFSGHGLQYKGDSYLFPTDARVRDEADLRRLIKLTDVIEDLAGAHHNRILIVDASRDNEVAQQVAGTLPAERAAAFGHGLAKLPDPEGAFVVSATQPNAVTPDGKGRNSPFTQALLKRMQQTPGATLKALMNGVRTDLAQASGGAQRPDIADGLAGEFVFKAGN